MQPWKTIIQDQEQTQPNELNKNIILTVKDLELYV